MQISASRIFTTTALTTVLCAQSAWADVTGRDVWNSWRDSMSGFGYDISATERTDGDVLTIEGLVVTMPIPEEDANMSIDMGTFAFEDLGDGTVRVLLPDTAPIQVNIEGDGENVDLDLALTSVGMNNIVSGTPEALVYKYTASQIALGLEKIVVDGESIEDIEASMTLTGVEGMSETTFGDLMHSTQKGSIDGIAFVANGTDPETGEDFDVQFAASGMELDGTATVPLGDYDEDPAAFFADGFDIAGSYSVQSTGMNVSFVEDGTPGVFAYTSGPGEVGIDMDSEGMAYDGSVTKVALNIAGSEIPVPIDVNFGEMGYGFKMPLAAGDAPQDFALNLKLLDLSVSEMLWGMFDPGQQLPRDPASLVVDLTGAATVLMDILSLDEDSDEIPGELNALNIDDLQLSIAGASLTGAGAFTFDNTDLESFDGFPRPEGSVDLTINGINGLMDTLVSMGLLPEEQAMGARMMMSMFTAPGAGDDSLTSKIEVNDKGQVLANGQRLK